MVVVRRDERDVDVDVDVAELIRQLNVCVTVMNGMDEDARRR